MLCLGQHPVRCRPVRCTAADLNTLPATPLCAQTLPFLLVGVGVDDVFILIGAYFQQVGAFDARGCMHAIGLRGADQALIRRFKHLKVKRGEGCSEVIALVGVCLQQVAPGGRFSAWLQCWEGLREDRGVSQGDGRQAGTRQA